MGRSTTRAWRSPSPARRSASGAAGHRENTEPFTRRRPQWISDQPFHGHTARSEQFRSLQTAGERSGVPTARKGRRILCMRGGKKGRSTQPSMPTCLRASVPAQSTPRPTPCRRHSTRLPDQAPLRTAARRNEPPVDRAPSIERGPGQARRCIESSRRRASRCPVRAHTASWSLRQRTHRRAGPHAAPPSRYWRQRSSRPRRSGSPAPRRRHDAGQR